MKGKISTLIPAFVFFLAVASGMTALRIAVDVTKLFSDNPEKSSLIKDKPSTKSISPEVGHNGILESSAILFAPMVICPPADTVDCDAPRDTNALGSPMVMEVGPCTTIDTIYFRDSIDNIDCSYTFNLFRIWTVKDTCQDSTICIQSIRVQDTTRPVITNCPGAATVYRDPACAIDTSTSSLGTAAATDNCTVVTDITYRDSIDNETCPQSFTIYRIWTATDSCSNSATCIQAITVLDTTRPEITNCPGDATVYRDAACAIDTSTSSLGTATATDNCTVVTDITYRDSIDDETCPHSFTIYRIWTATDSCSNSATCIQTITVSDTTRPTIVCPDDLTIYRDGSCGIDTTLGTTGSPTIGDNCGTPSLDYSDNTAGLDQCSGTGTIIRTFTVTDSCGNTNTCDQTITVSDTTRPTIICPDDLTIYRDGSCGIDTTLGTTGSPTIGDNCGTPSLDYSDNTAGLDQCSGTGTIIRTFTVTDSCGNTNTCDQTITVSDTTRPTIICPDDLTIYRDGSCGIDTTLGTTGSPTIGDNCGTPSLDYSDNTAGLDQCSGTGTIIRTFTVTDSCGNTNTCDQTITVSDTTRPTIVCPADLTIYRDGSCGIDTTLGTTGSPTIGDNCGTPSLDYSDNTAGLDQCSGTGTIIRTFTVTDSCGNTNTCDQTITVSDTTRPTIVCPDDLTIYRDGSCGIDTTLGTTGSPTIGDNCGTLSLDYSDNTAGLDQCSGTGTIIRTFTVTDSCGNTNTCDQTITVLDTTRPTITCPLDTLVNCFTDVPAVDLNAVLSTDNCTQIVIITHVGDSIGDSTCINGLTVFRTYRATDSCGNFNECIQQITVLDTEDPQFTYFPNDTLVVCASDLPVQIPLASDNCGLVRVSLVEDIVTDSGCINQFTLLHIWEAVDTCQNMIRDTQVVVVRDTLLPQFTYFPADTLVNCMADLPVQVPEASDNCGLVRVSLLEDIITDSNCINQFTLLHIWAAVDTCQNMIRDTQVVIVRDTLLPAFTVFPNDTTVACAADIAIQVPEASDNCGLVRVSLVEENTIDSSCVNQKTRLFIWEAVDTCQNAIRDTQFVFVLDTIGPVIPIPGNIEVVQCGTFFSIVLGIVATDNCDGMVPVDAAISVIDSTCPGDYKILIVYTSNDTCGNFSEVRDTIIVIDTLDPIITCPGDFTLECDGNLPPPITSLDSFFLAGGQIYDSCCLDSSSFRFIQEILDCEVDGDPTLSRYYAIDDCCGHSDTCVQVITIPPCLLDLALRKTLNAPEPYFAGYGGTVPFTITVYNQFCVPADSIKIIDYLPSVGSSVISPGWVNNNDGTACLLLTDNDVLPLGGLPFGDSVVISFTVKLGLDFGDGTGINRAEIFSANTPDGPASDVDSDPNNNPGDDIIVDDVIDNSGSDEDDYDIAQFFVCQPLVCNNHVNVSLEEDCELCFTADDFLEGGALPEEYYTIELFAGGKKLPGNCVDRAYLGYTLTYSVLINSPCGNNSCWGTVTIEDKAPPFIDCSPDTVLCFELSNLPSEGTVNDNCSGPVKVNVVSEQYIDYGCDSAFIQGVVKRRLIATDTWKNTVDCEKIYYVRRLSIEDLVCPRDTVIDCSLEVVNKVPFTHPSRSGAPTIEGIALWPNNVSCKVLTDYKDEISEVCGDGYKIFRTWTIVDWCGRRDTMCTQTIKVIDQTPPLAYDRTLPTMKADPHVCRAQIQLDTLAVSDCSKVIQTYSYPYLDEATGVIKIASGTLPARVWVTSGVTVIDVTLTDGCFNRSQNTITVKVVDETPPTPVCKEYTQVTVDPVSCWTVVKAKDLDNGSHDNCIKPLHFAVARMSDIEKARTDYLAKIEAECGIKEYKEHKAWYDQYIEDWINMYVFDDELHMDDCGENQVVLRVYEADSMPRLDPHIWKCGEHEWFCYNTYPSYRLVHNYHFFSTNPPASKDCDAGAPWLCKKASEKWFADRKNQFEFSRYYGTNDGANFPQTRLFNDCMVKVIVDDKQPPVVDHLEDITVYCDNAPAGMAYARQLCKYGEEFEHWPGPLSYQGKTYGYYGGSDHIRRGHTDHQDPVYGCDHGDQWAPIYCRKWLYLDSFDQSGPVDPAQYFSTLVKFDKDRPARPLGAKEFSITDNCRLDDTTLHITDIGSVNGCGEGWYQRTWRIKDKCGNEAVAVQKVIIKHRSDFEVVFPPDLEVTCDTENATDSSRTGKPEITDDECEIIGVRYVDEISTIDQGDGACYKIIRTWTLIDWCIYDPNAHTIHPDVIVDDRLRANDTDRVCVFRNLKDNGDGFMKYVQIIKVFDHEAPVLNCRDTTICLTEGCQQGVNIPLEGSDNCSEEVLYRLDITRPDGSVETRVNVNSISGNFTAGVYTIRIIGKDHCDNADTCTMRLTMQDCKEPTPYCLNGIATVVMPLTGAIEIWAKDLDRGSTDNCTPNSALKFSFSSNVGEASRVFRCSDIPDGKQQAIPVDIWVTDQAGNQNYCRTYILLQDNGGQPGGVCRDTTLTTANINGKLFTEDKEGVEFATVELKGVGQATIPSFKTGSDGNFAFSNIQLTGPVSIKALRDDNPMNGLSTLDLVLLQKHLLGTEKLKSPYKMIAADVNNSQDINVVDLVELRKLILGLYDRIPGNTSWKFIPKSHSFTDVQNPWGYPTEELLDKMQETEVRDFVGVKIGDLNSSAVPHSLIGTEVRGNDIGLTLETEDRVVRKGEEVSVTFRSPNFRGISGWQGTLHTGGLQYLGVRKAGKLDLTEDHIGRRWAGEGMLTMSWHHHTGLDLDEKAPLFTLVFRAGEDGRLSEMLRFGSQHTISESYEGKGELGGLSLRFVTAEGNSVASRSELYQNYPNPFDQRTVIGINLEKEGKGVLRILDITGRTLRSFERDWSKGYQEVWLDRREIGASGVLYYRFESEFFTASRKMMIID